MIVTDAIKNWLHNKFTGDATIFASINTRIFQSVGDEKSLYPFVVYDFLTGEDIHGLCREILLTEIFIQVKFIHNKPLTNGDRAVTSKIHEVLQSTASEISNGYVFIAKRVQPIDFKEPIPGSTTVYYHIGGVYMVSIHTQ